MKHGARRLIAIAISGLTLMSLFIYGAGAVYIRFASDDYCHVVLARQYGVAGMGPFYYFNWSGRFAHYTSLAVAMLAGLPFITLLTMGVLVIWWLALFALFVEIATVREWPHPMTISVAATSLTLLVIFNSVLSLIQSYYWASGILLYTVPLVLFTIYGALVVWQLRGGIQNRVARSALFCTYASLTFLAAGYSEMYALAQTMGLAAAYAFWRRNPSVRSRWPALLAGLLGSTLGFVIVVVAPGNAVRLAVNPRPDLPAIILGALSGPLATIFVTIKFWPWSAVAVILLPAWLAYYGDPFHSHQRVRQMRRALLLIPCVIFVLIAACFATAFYGTSAPPPERAWIVPQTILVAGSMVWSYILGLTLKPTLGDLKPSIWLRYVAAIFLVIALISSLQKSIDTVKQLKGYADAWDKQDSQIRSKQNEMALITIIPIENISGLEDISSDSNFWVNHCMARYYGVAAIAGDPAFAPAKHEQPNSLDIR